MNIKIKLTFEELTRLMSFLSVSKIELFRKNYPKLEKEAEALLLLLANKAKEESQC